MADIILSNICKRFGEKTLFENFSLKIERGEFLSIMGESGAGKTTLLNMMGLLDRPDSGTVVLCGQKKNDCCCHSRSPCKRVCPASHYVKGNSEKQRSRSIYTGDEYHSIFIGAKSTHY